jgi:hypothetical protein
MPGQPPVTVAEASHVANAAFICACDENGGIVIGAGHVKTGVDADVTVKVRVQVCVAPPQPLLVAVKVTETEPPQALGGATALFETVAEQPPVTVAVASHALNLVLICACVWQVASVLSTAQFSTIAGAAFTKKVRVHETGAWQLLVAVKVTSTLPPQADGAPVLLLVSVTPQPPETEADASQVAYFALMAAWVWQVASAWFAGQERMTGLPGTVKVRVQVTGAWQPLVTVKTTIFEPPQAKGAPVLLFVKTALQPPETVAEASHALYAASTCACVWQSACVLSAGQFNTTVGAAVTVKVRVQVAATPQVDIAVKVTVLEPPQAKGAPVLLFVNVALQPPVTVAEANQALYLVLMSAVDWQAASVTSVGQFRLTTGAVATVKVLVQFTGAWQSLVTVKVTVATPPQAIGGPVPLFVKTALQPPDRMALATHALYFVLISACVWQAASEAGEGQTKLTAGAGLTVKVRVQVCVTSQLLVTVKVTVTEPPQANGAPMLLLVSVRLQPPVAVAEASQARYLTLICDCV